jgi:hypothetical protein
MAEIGVGSGEPKQVTKPRIFRVSDIPASWTSGTLKVILENHGLHLLSEIRLVPSVLTKGTCTAALSLDTDSHIARALTENQTGEYMIDAQGAHLVIDQHFYGLTAIYSPNTSPKAEYVQW